MLETASKLVSDIKPWLEAVYFLSGIVVCILAALGLKQLKLAKHQIEITREIFKTQSKRSAFESAISQCNKYSRHIIQLDHKITKFISENEITILKDTKISEIENGFSIDISGVNREHVEKLYDIAELVSDFANSVEGFALYILSGVADEDIAFSTVGKLYLRHAEIIAKMSAFTDATQEDAAHIWKLYFKWKKRSERQRLEIEKKKIDDKIRKNQVEPIRSIGVD